MESIQLVINLFKLEDNILSIEVFENILWLLYEILINDDDNEMKAKFLAERGLEIILEYMNRKGPVESILEAFYQFFTALIADNSFRRLDIRC